MRNVCRCHRSLCRTPSYRLYICLYRHEVTGVSPHRYILISSSEHAYHRARCGFIIRLFALTAAPSPYHLAASLTRVALPPHLLTESMAAYHRCGMEISEKCEIVLTYAISTYYVCHIYIQKENRMEIIVNMAIIFEYTFHAYPIFLKVLVLAWICLS